MTDLSIIIVSYNTQKITIECIDSVVKSLQNSKIAYEIIVVDNNSSDGTVGKIENRKSKIENLKLVESKSNVGFGKANNTGWGKAQGKYVLFLNSDVLIDNVNFDLLVQTMDKEKSIGVMTVRVNFPDGKIDPACHRGSPTLWRSFCYFAKIEHITKSIPLLNRIFGGYHLTHLNLNKSHEIESPSGAFFLTRREILEETGGFDESFFMYGEDLDLALRIKEDGYKIFYCPDWRVTHYKYQSGLKNKDDRARLSTKKYFYESMTIFYKKHYEKTYSVFINKLIYAILNKLITKYDQDRC